MRHRTPPTIKPGMTEEEYQDEVADYLDACEGDREDRESRKEERSTNGD